MTVRSVLSSDTVAELAGITYRQLHSWVVNGRVAPTISPRQGSGLPMRWTPADAELVMRMARLVKAGVRVEIAAALARQHECPICGGVIEG